MGLLSQQFQSLVWHVVTGKYEVLPNGELRKRDKSELKTTNIPWLGNIPKHWRVNRVKDFSINIAGKTPSTEEPEYWADATVNWITPEDLKPGLVGHIQDSKTKISELAVQKCGMRLCPTGSIVIGAIGSIGNLAKLEKPACTNQNCFAIVPDNSNTVTEWQIMLLRPAMEAATGESTLKIITPNKVVRLEIPVTGAEESSRISHFLENAAKKHICAQQRLTSALTLAEQQFQSLVWHVVTGKYEVMENGRLRKRGMRELQQVGTGVINVIPAEWTTRRLKDLFEFAGGGTPDRANPALWTEEINWVSPSDLLENGFAEVQNSEIKISKQAISSKIQVFPKGSVVISRRAPVGSLGVLAQPATVNDGCKVLIPKQNQTPDIWSLVALQSELRALANGTTFDGISSDTLGRVIIPIPTPSESPLILTFLNQQRKQYQEKVSKLEHLL